MITRTKTAALAAGCALSLGACAGNYAGEGALGGAAVGAAAGVLTGGDVARGAAVGAAVGGVGGALIRKDGRCFRRDRDGDEYRVRCPD
jgi:hypothetical protein